MLVRWIKKLKGSTRVLGPYEVPQQWHEGAWRLVFIPISNRFETSNPRVYLGALAHQLAQFAREPAPDNQGSDTYFRDVAKNLLDKLAAQGKCVLLVLDGLDEELGHETLSGILPAPLPPAIKVLVSARWQPGEEDNGGWLARLGWNGRARAPGHDLIVKQLDERAIAEALQRMDPPMRRLGFDPALVARLTALTEGEPLLLRFYVEDLWDLEQSGKRASATTLQDDQPGFAAYFSKTLASYRSRGAGRRTVDDSTIDPSVAIVGFAEGPLAGEEFRAIANAGFPKLAWVPNLAWDYDARSHIEPFQRFLVSRRGRPVAPYAFVHPKLRDHVRYQYCSTELAERTIRAYCDRGRRHVKQLNDGVLSAREASRYVLLFYTEHLSAAPANATATDYLALVEDGWRRAKEHLDGGGQGSFARDVRTAWDAIRRHDRELAHLGAQWRCALALSSIKSLGINIPGPLLVELVRDRALSPQQARHYCELKGPTEEAVETLARIAVVIADSQRGAGEMAKAAVDLALRARDEESRVNALVRALDNLHLASDKESERPLTPHLDPAQRQAALAEALAAASAIGDEGWRSEALAALASGTSTAEGRELMRFLLDTVANASRPVAMQAARDAVALIAELGESSAIGDLRRAINDVCRWYP